MESLGIEQIQIVVLAGAIVALISRRLKMPYMVGLVIAGLIVAFFHIPLGISFSKDLLFKALLPPLIFEGALYIQWRELRRDLLPIVAYATLGVILSAGVTAGFMHLAVGWTWAAAILFGILIAATDPVSVIATFKESKVEGRLRLLVEAESLFNDSTAAVGFAVALAFASGVSVTFGTSVAMMFLSIIGGIASGLVVGGFVLIVIGRTQDHLVELSMTTVAAFGSFWLAEHFQLSGILATTTAGLMVGNMPSLSTLTAKGEKSIEHFWDFAAFVVNSIIFIVLGINLAYQDLAKSAVPIIVAIIAVLVGRAVAVYPCSALFYWTRYKVAAKHQHIMFWGGLRGALALALALGIPADLTYRQEILTVTFGVVAFSVFGQGLTIPAVLRRLGQIADNKNDAQAET